MPQGTVKCSRKQCATRSFYPNQITPVPAGNEVYGPCPNCIKAINKTIGDRGTLAVMIKTTMTLAEVKRIRDERRADYAMGAFCFGEVAA